MIDLQHGDSFEILKDFPDAYFTACVTDPPYGLSSTPDMAEVLKHWLAGDDYQHRGGGFMGKSWDSFVPGPKLWAEVLRVMRPGAHLLCFAGSRTQDLMATSLRLAGFEIRDTIMWCYGSGFPKSLSIDKAIDRMRFDRPEVLEVTGWIASARDATGLKNSDIDAAFGFVGMAGHWTSQKSQPTVPTLEQVPLILEALGNPEVPERIRQLLFELNGRKGTPGADWLKREVVGQRVMTDTSHVTNACSLAAQGVAVVPKRVVDLTVAASDRSRPWSGHGTALKPAYEPVIVAMRPCVGTFAQNALQHGVAGMNVDACRVPLDEGDSLQDGIDREEGAEMDTGGGEGSWGFKRVSREAGLGRWPANVAHDGSPEVLACFPDAPGQQGDLNETGRDRPSKGTFGDMAPPRPHAARKESSKSAARFFYCPKPSNAERDIGLEGVAKVTEAEQVERDPDSAGASNPRAGAGSKRGRANVHPTVKPVELMRWLARMVKMPGENRVLDPFLGSGTTGMACAREGMDFVGVEQNAEYLEIARRRIEGAK